MWREEVGITEMMLAYISEFTEFDGWSSWRSVVVDIITCHENVRRQRVTKAVGEMSDQGVEASERVLNDRSESMTLREATKHEQQMFDEVLDISTPCPQPLNQSNRDNSTVKDCTELVDCMLNADKSHKNNFEDVGIEVKEEVMLHDMEVVATGSVASLHSEFFSPTENTDSECSEMLDRRRCYMKPSQQCTYREAKITHNSVVTEYDNSFNSLNEGTVDGQMEIYNEPGTVTGSSMEAGKFPFICNFCGRLFKYSSNRRRHERIHTGEKPFGCSLCSKTFSDATAKRRHQMTHLRRMQTTHVNSNAPVN